MLSILTLLINQHRYVECYDIFEWKALMLAGQNSPVRKARMEYIFRHCRKKKKFMCLNSHRCQGCLRNKNAIGVPILEKMCSNLLTDSTTRDLKARADLVEVI